LLVELKLSSRSQSPLQLVESLYMPVSGLVKSNFKFLAPQHSAKPYPIKILKSVDSAGSVDSVVSIDSAGKILEGTQVSY
jgi:hypothetical protein